MRKLIHYLQKLDHDHQYTIFMRSEDIEVWSQLNDSFAVRAADYAAFSFAEQFGLLRDLRSVNPDLVHFCLPHRPLLWGGASVTTFHDLTLLRFRNARKSLLQSYAKRGVGALAFLVAAHRSAISIAPSRFSANDLHRFAILPVSRIRVTYEAADPIDVPPTPPDTQPNGAFVLYVGAQFVHKNLPMMIQALANMRRAGSEIELVIAGSIDDDGHRLAAGLSQGDYGWVRMLGRVSDSTLRWLYENADAYVFPSLREGFGLPGLEAMRHGCPVVSSRASCLPEIYGDAALYFDPESAASITDALNRILNDQGLQDRQRERGFSQAAEYSWERMAQETRAIYLEALARH